MTTNEINMTGHALRKRLDLQKILFYTAFVLYFISYNLTYTTFEIDYLITGIQALVLFFLALKLLLQKYLFWQPFVVLALIVISFLSWISSDDKSLILLVTFVLAGQRADFKTLAKIALYCEIVILVIVVGSNLIGLIPSVLEYRDNGFIRNSFGFSHPNRLGSSLFVVVIADVILSYPRFGWRNIGLILATIFANVWICDSRGPLFATLILVISIFILKFSSSHQKYVKYVLALALLSVVIVISFSLYCTFNYDRTISWMLALNNLLSGRLELASYYWHVYPPSLFGQSFENAQVFLNSFQSVIIDNAYIRVIMVYGIVPGFILIMSLLALFVYAYRRRILSLWLIFVFIYALFGFFESQSLHFAMNYGLIGLSGLFYGSLAYQPKRRKRIRSAYQPIA